MRNVVLGKCYRDNTKNLWACEVRWKDGADKSCKKTLTSKNKTRAKEKAMAFRDSLIMNGPQVAEPTSNITFREYAENWLCSEEAVRLKPTSFARKKQVLENQVYPYIGRILLPNVTRADVKH